MKHRISLALLALALAIPALAQEPAKRPPSPRGAAQAQVGGKWEKQGEEMRYTGGKWIEVDYGRPIKRGREPLFGSGADYGKKFLDGAPVWRLGANKTTSLTTEVPLMLGGKRVEPGTYALFVDLKDGAWTLVVSTQKMAAKYDPDAKDAGIWGSYGYDAKFDVVRVPMKMEKGEHSVEQLTIGFADMSEKGGQLFVAWDTTRALAPFSVAEAK